MEKNHTIQQKACLINASNYFAISIIIHLSMMDVACYAEFISECRELRDAFDTQCDYKIGCVVNELVTCLLWQLFG